MLSREFQTGRDLSGGQWQRLSVARGLYRDAPLVIADEPTAALDARAEHAVFGTLHGRTGAGAERITVLVTHRLANVRFADQILVLERGRVIEHGRHDELMALRGTYFELFTLQARAYAGGARWIGYGRPMTELVHLDVADGVATITLDSPANRNALSGAAAPRAARPHLDTAIADEAARVIVLTPHRAGVLLGHGPQGVPRGRRAGPGGQRVPGHPGADLDLPDTGAGPARRPGPGRRGRPGRGLRHRGGRRRTPRSRSARSGSGWCRR